VSDSLDVLDEREHRDRETYEWIPDAPEDVAVWETVADWPEE